MDGIGDGAWARTRPRWRSGISARQDLLSVQADAGLTAELNDLIGQTIEAVEA